MAIDLSESGFVTAYVLQFWVNIGSDKSLVPDSITSLPESMDLDILPTLLCTPFFASLA